MSINAFMPLGPSYLVAANATAPSGVRILSCGNLTVNGLRLFNADTANTIYYGLGGSAEEARTNATVPTASGNMSLGLPPLSVEVIRTKLPVPNVWVSGITSVSTQANLIVTAGDGV